MTHLALTAWTHAAVRIRPPEADETPLSPDECWIALREGFVPAPVVILDCSVARIRNVWAKNIDPEEAAA